MTFTQFEGLVWTLRYESRSTTGTRFRHRRCGHNAITCTHDASCSWLFEVGQSQTIPVGHWFHLPTTFHKLLLRSIFPQRRILPIVIRGNSSWIVNLISSSLFRCFWSFEGRKCHQVSPQSVPPPITMSFPKYRCIASRTRCEATTLELLPIPFTNNSFTSLKLFLVAHPRTIKISPSMRNIF